MIAQNVLFVKHIKENKSFLSLFFLKITTNLQKLIEKVPDNSAVFFRIFTNYIEAQKIFRPKTEDLINIILWIYALIFLYTGLNLNLSNR